MLAGNGGGMGIIQCWNAASLLPLHLNYMPALQFATFDCLFCPVPLATGTSQRGALCCPASSMSSSCRQSPAVLRVPTERRQSANVPCPAFFWACPRPAAGTTRIPHGPAVQEACIRDVVVLFRRKVPKERGPPGEKEVLRPGEADPAALARNIQIRQFAGIPLADLVRGLPARLVGQGRAAGSSGFRLQGQQGCFVPPGILSPLPLCACRRW